MHFRHLAQNAVTGIMLSRISTMAAPESTVMSRTGLGGLAVSFFFVFSPKMAGKCMLIGADRKCLKFMLHSRVQHPVEKVFKKEKSVFGKRFHSRLNI